MLQRRFWRRFSTAPKMTTPTLTKPTTFALICSAGIISPLMALALACDHLLNPSLCILLFISIVQVFIVSHV